MGFFRAFADRHGLGSVRAHHVSATAKTVHDVGVGALVGGGLGAIHAMAPLGLDYKGKAPIDGMIAAAGVAAAIGLSEDPVASASARSVATAASTIFSFRKAYQFAAAKKAADLSKAPELRIPGDRVQEQNVLLSKQQAGKTAALAAHGDFGAFGADAGQEDPILTAARSL